MDGLVIPMVCSPQEAEQAIAACTYPPAGVRGMGPFRADNYGLVPTADYLAAADRQIFKILQIEHIDAVKQIEEILDVPGIDAIIVGQFDLSGSLGILGQVYAPENLEQIRTVFRACRRRGIHCGISVSYTHLGAYSQKANADAQAARLKAAGFEVLIKKVANLYKVQTGAYSKKANADAQVSKLKAKGFDAFVTTNGGGTAASGDTPKKSNTEIAKEVIAGKWGNGADRKKRLEAAGYNYAAVQKIVNSML